MGILTRIWLLLIPLLLKLTRNDSAKQFLQLSLEDQKNLLKDLAQYNLKVVAVEKKGENYQKWSFYIEAIRQHYQLPCTIDTRENRAAYLEALVGKSKTILLLGDDDLVSWELAKRGFQDVTASDCDAILLDRIQSLSSGEKTPPRLIHGDFSDPAFTIAKVPDVVCIDPPYNLKWTFIFIDKALQTVRDRNQAYLILMINPYCFNAADWQAICLRLGAQGLVLKQRLERFNGYPLQGLSSALLKLGLKVLIKGNERKRKLQSKLYFSSDLYLFERNHLPGG